MRDISTRLIGPNLAKSTCGHAGRCEATPVDGAAALLVGLAPLAITPLTCERTSSSVMRPFGPLPRTAVRSTPSSRANLRTDGDACGFAPGAGPRSSGSGRAPISVANACERVGVSRPLSARALRAPAASRERRRTVALTCGAAAPAVGRCQRRHRRSLGHLVAELDLQLLDHSGVRRRNFHRRFIAFHRDQRLIFRDGIARLDQKLDDFDILEVTDIGNGDFNSL